MRAAPVPASAAIVILSALLPMQAQDAALDEEAVALVFHKVSGDPLDAEGAAARSDAAMRASGFDRPAVIRQEAARLQSRLAAADPAREFVISVNTTVSQYDHDAHEFSVQLFTPGHYVTLEAFHQTYRLVFANADRARRVPMPTEEARGFDGRLNRGGRSVVAEARFTVTGKGDPAGAVVDGRVIRAEILAVRLLDRGGDVLFTPDLAAASPAELHAAAFDPATVDVAGLRVGVTASDLEATLTRLYGKASRGGVQATSYARFAGSISMNPSGCFSVPGRRGNPRPGSVCIEAYFDGNEVVRSIRIQQYFPYFDPELLRAALLRKYGPIVGGRSGSSLGWGPVVQNGQRALSADYAADRDVFSDGLNSAPNVRVALQLVDAAWVAANRR